MPAVPPAGRSVTSATVEREARQLIISLETEEQHCFVRKLMNEKQVGLRRCGYGGQGKPNRYGG